MVQNLLLLFWSVLSPDFLELRIEGIQEAKGVIRIAFYDSREIHLNEKDVTYYYEKPVANTGEMDVRIELPEGAYSIAIYHDLNSDEQLNKNLFGIPNEPYGFSNNVMGMFGPPSFEQAKIDFPNTNKLSITLR